MKTFRSDAGEMPANVEMEKAVLGAMLLDEAVCPQAEELTSDDFTLDSHRRIFALIAAMAENKEPIDSVTVTMKLNTLKHLQFVGGAAYVASLTEGVPKRTSIAHCVKLIREATKRRRLICSADAFSARAMSPAEPVDSIAADAATAFAEMRTAFDSDDWHSLFHSYEEIESAPPVRFAIDGFLQAEGVTLIGGLAGHGKTLCMLAMVRALLEGGKLFHYFGVNETAERVIYLIPEAGLGPFSTRLKIFRLMDHIRAGRLFVRTLSARGSSLSLTDPQLLRAVSGADIFLDTAIRFMTGDENNASEQKLFAEMLFGLQRAGARTIVGAHHSPKSFGKDHFMTLENVLRGSGDIGAMVATCWGLSQIDPETNRIYVENVKPRDFKPCEPFIIQGRPSLDQTGYFELSEPPGFAGTLSEHKDRKAGRPSEKDDKLDQALQLKNQGMSVREIGRKLGVGSSTVSRWLSE